MPRPCEEVYGLEGALWGVRGGGTVVPSHSAEKKKKAIRCNAKEGSSQCLPPSGLGGNRLRKLEQERDREVDRDRINKQTQLFRNIEVSISVCLLTECVS